MYDVLTVEFIKRLGWWCETDTVCTVWCKRKCHRTTSSSKCA